MACWKTFHWVRRFSQRTKPPFIVCSSHIFQIYDFPSYKQNFPSIYWDFPWEKHTVRGKLTSATTAPWPWNSAASDTRRRRSPALPGPAWRGAWGAAWQVGRENALGESGEFGKIYGKDEESEVGHLDLRWFNPWRIHGAGIYMLTWLGYIDGIHVTIYSSTTDPTIQYWNIGTWCFFEPPSTMGFKHWNWLSDWGC